MKRERALGEGAAEFAPTAPHATPPPKGAAARRSKVGRIYRPLGVVTALALTASLGVHGAAVVKAVGPPPEIEFKDVDDELTIPIDMFEDSPPPPPAPAPEPAPAGAPGEGPGTIDAGAKPARDAGAPSPHDAGADAEADAAPPPKRPVHDAGSEIPLSDLDAGAEGDAGTGDAGGGGLGPRDPSSMVGLSGLVNTGPQNVILLVNMAAIRKHPASTQLGRVFAAIPQWESFIRGHESMVDPVRDTDWIMIYGPSLIHTEKDAVLVRYSLSDALVDKALDVMATGGAYDTGVKGVKASMGHADNADRVFMRAGSKLLAVVPPDKAKDFARVLSRNSAKPRINPSEAMRLVVRNPHRQISIPGLKFPTDLEELRIWIVPNDDGSATVFAEGTVTSADGCPEVAAFMNQVFTRVNTGLVQMFTNNLLGGANVTCDGNVPKAQVVAPQRTIEKLITVSLTFLGGAQ